jgi:hypothetical protein
VYPVNCYVTIWPCRSLSKNLGFVFVFAPTARLFLRFSDCDSPSVISITGSCGTDLHILRGEYPVKPGLIIGHEPVGIIHELGEGITGYEVGDRVLVGAITPCGQCNFCLGGNWSQCGGPLGGLKFGNTINGAQAEYLLVPHAPIPARRADYPEQIIRRHAVSFGADESHKPQV